jgi:hypothetical protein
MPLYQHHSGVDYENPIVLKTVSTTGDIFMDSCATHLFTNDLDGFQDIVIHKKPTAISGTTGKSNLCEGTGTYRMMLGSKEIFFPKAIYAPSLEYTLVSLPQLETMGFSYSHIPNTHLVEYYAPGDIEKKFPIAVSTSEGNNLQTLLPPAEIHAVAKYSSTKTDQPLTLIHKRVGHLNSKMILQMEDYKSALGLNINKKDGANDARCKVCTVSKSKKKPYNNEHQRIAEVGEKMCVNYKPFGFDNIFKFSGFFLIVDKGSRYGTLVNVQNRQNFKKLLENYEAFNHRNGYILKTFKSDGAGEFLSENSNTWLTKQGIAQEVSAAHGQAENSVVESRIRILLQMLRSVQLEIGKIEKDIIPYLIESCNYIFNRTGTPSPFELYFNEKPNLNHFRVLGCFAVVQIPKKKRKSIDTPAHYGRFIGYSASFGEPHYSGYYIYNGTQKIQISRDVDFFEDNFNFSYKNLKSNVNDIDKIYYEIAKCDDPNILEINEHISTTQTTNSNKSDSDSNFVSASEGGGGSDSSEEEKVGEESQIKSDLKEEEDVLKDDEFIVEKILDSKYFDTILKYLIKKIRGNLLKIYSTLKKV